MSYQKYGILEIWDAFKVKGSSSHQKSTDNISIYLNNELIFTSKDKKVINLKLKDLLIPEIVEFIDYLIIH